ncbi:MAG: hypothetical protein DGJ47_001059 [Rickettsiaceae bacterium]
MENKITSLIEDTINMLGFELVKVIVRGSATKVVEVLIEAKEDRGIMVEDCRLVSKNISAILDVEDAVPGKYFLEVSSAGIERPLTKISDYKKFTGREVKIKLKEALNNSYSFKGKILGIEEESIKLQSKNVQLSFAFSNIKSGKLVMTDEMFREALKKTK